MRDAKNYFYEKQLRELRQEKATYRQKLHIANSKLKQIETCLQLYSSDIIELEEMVKGIDKVLDWSDEV